MKRQLFKPVFFPKEKNKTYEDIKLCDNMARDYNEYMQSPQWKKIRKEKLKEAGYKCENCGTAKNLCVHHINYENYNKKGWGNEDLDDLAVLCKNCHDQVHEPIPNEPSETESEVFGGIIRLIFYYLILGIFILPLFDIIPTFIFLLALVAINPLNNQSKIKKVGKMILTITYLYFALIFSAITILLIFNSELYLIIVALSLTTLYFYLTKINLFEHNYWLVEKIKLLFFKIKNQKPTTLKNKKFNLKLFTILGIILIVIIGIIIFTNLNIQTQEKYQDSFSSELISFNLPKNFVVEEREKNFTYDLKKSAKLNYLHITGDKNIELAITLRYNPKMENKEFYNNYFNDLKETFLAKEIENKNNYFDYSKAVYWTEKNTNEIDKRVIGVVIKDNFKIDISGSGINQEELNKAYSIIFETIKIK